MREDAGECQDEAGSVEGAGPAGAHWAHGGFVAADLALSEDLGTVATLLEQLCVEESCPPPNSSTQHISLCLWHL